MKIGILTFHNAHNYGAMLQCYALQQYLISEGYDAEVIDYRPDFYKKQYSENRFIDCLGKNPFRWFNNIYYNYYLHNKRCHSFEHFHEKYLIMSKERNCQIIPDTYDAYIVGSDQIWNPNLTNGFQKVYFCLFGNKQSNKKYISYAPSMEINNLSREQIIFLKNALKNFNSISVREKSLINLLQPLTNLPITQVCDPTLLVDINVWEPMAKKRLIKDSYIVLYQIRESEIARNLAKKIASQNNASIVELTARIDKKINCKYQTASPTEFVNYIANAEYVITTSFHGTALSVIFNKPFYSVSLGDNFDSRSISFLKSLQLEDRIISQQDDIIIKPINYNRANELIKIQREQSRQFLKSALI